MTSTAPYNGITRFYWDTAHVIEERVVTGGVERLAGQYINGGTVDDVLAMDRDTDGDAVLDSLYFLLRDYLGNVVHLVSGGGLAVEHYLYGLFGTPTVYDGQTLAEIGPSSPSDNPYLFTGRRYEPETGLYYYRARYYDPEHGEFLTRDPIGFWGDPKSLGNPMAYAGNDPWNRTDPSGLNNEGGSQENNDGQSWEDRVLIGITIARLLMAANGNSTQLALEDVMAARGDKAGVNPMIWTERFYTDEAKQTREDLAKTTGLARKYFTEGYLQAADHYLNAMQLAEDGCCELAIAATVGYDSLKWFAYGTGLDVPSLLGYPVLTIMGVETSPYHWTSTQAAFLGAQHARLVHWDLQTDTHYLLAAQTYAGTSMDPYSSRGAPRKGEGTGPPGKAYWDSPEGQEAFDMMNYFQQFGYGNEATETWRSSPGPVDWAAFAEERGIALPQ